MPGLPRRLIKKYGVSKEAWRVFKAEQQKKGKTNKAKKPNRSNVRPMAKKKNKRRRSFLSLPTLGKFIKIGALVAPAVNTLMKSATTQAKSREILQRYTGYNIDTGAFRFEDLITGWGPFVATSAVIVGIQKLNGIIRRI